MFFCIKKTSLILNKQEGHAGPLFLTETRAGIYGIWSYLVQFARQLHGQLKKRIHAYHAMLHDVQGRNHSQKEKTETKPPRW